MTFTVQAVIVVLLVLGGGMMVVANCPEKYSCSTYKECAYLDFNGMIFRCEDGKVCCPPAARPDTLTSRLSGASEVTQETTPPGPQAQGALLPQDECGRQTIGMRIANGEDADLGQFPWMTLLAYRVNGTSKKQYLCGGTLLNNRYVLTAAHCVSDRPPMSVRLGEYDLSQDPDCEDSHCADAPVDVEVEKVIAHNNYNKPFMKNDVALLRLKTAVSLTDYISPACLPLSFNITGNEEKNYTAVGWGMTENEDEGRSDILQFVSVPSVPMLECNDAQSDEVQPLDHTQLCAGGAFSGGEVCKGDSGGPLMDSVLGSDGKTRMYQLGIVSFGTFPCGKNDVPSVYTRVHAFLPWILANIEP